MSQVGRWNGAAFVNDGFTSSGLIDAADPLVLLVLNEVSPNGGRANLGSYGQTADASKSPSAPSPSVAGIFTSSSVSFPRSARTATS